MQKAEDPQAVLVLAKRPALLLAKVTAHVAAIAGETAYQLVAIGARGGKQELDGTGRLR
jgi:hypothetical protein